MSSGERVDEAESEQRPFTLPFRQGPDRDVQNRREVKTRDDDGIAAHIAVEEPAT
jgi:hypothetical protein